MPDAALSPNPNTFLLEGVSPTVRRILVKERIRALQGGIDGALKSLEDAIALVKNDHPRDAIALGLLQAELLHLELRDDEALAVMEKVVIPLMPFLTAAEGFGVEQNRSDLQLFSPGGDTALFYNIVDQKRLLDFEWLDYRDLFQAKQDAERGRHFETLPTLWQQHRRAYMQGCWLAQRLTNHLLARECIHLNEWEDAVHHAILARDESLMTDIAEGILSTRRADLADRVINRLLNTANLRTHFGAACNLFRGMMDAIPDSSIQAVGEWLLKRAREKGDISLSPAHFSKAWETIGIVGRRFPAKFAERVIALAINHPVWLTKYEDPNAFSRGRKEMVGAMLALSEVAFPEDIEKLASAAIPLVSDRPQLPDYDDVVNLLYHLAKRGSPELKDSLAASLYPPGRPVTHVLAQVADVFGKAEDFDQTRLQKLAEQVVQGIRRQVQWLEPNQPSNPPAEQIMEFTNPKGDRVLKVYVSALTGLHALARHRAKLDEPTLKDLVDAMLDLARNKDNFCVNRQGLLRGLIHFADVVTRSERDKIEAALVPLARGAVEESSQYPTAAQTDDPLNPYKHDSGRPEDVQGMAVVALAALAHGDVGATKRVQEILEDALCDHRPEIRRAGYAGARRLPDVSEGIILAILSGLRDPDPNAAVSAFAALTEQTGWKLNRNHLRVFLMAATLAQRTGGPKLRRHAASALMAWSTKCPPKLVEAYAKLLEEFSIDICWSVRSVTRPN